MNPEDHPVLLSESRFKGLPKVSRSEVKNAGIKGTGDFRRLDELSRECRGCSGTGQEIKDRHKISQPG